MQPSKVSHQTCSRHFIIKGCTPTCHFTMTVSCKIKVEKSLRRKFSQGKFPFYTDGFYTDSIELKLLLAAQFPHSTEHNWLLYVFSIV